MTMSAKGDGEASSFFLSKRDNKEQAGEGEDENGDRDWQQLQEITLTQGKSTSW